MQELSLHILDIAQNAVRAGAGKVDIALNWQGKQLTLRITDDGKGMGPRQLHAATDPFYTSRTTRKVGLGLPFLKMAAELTGGSLSLNSEEGAGTRVEAHFTAGHIDLAPLGDLGGTLAALVQTTPDIEYTVCVRRGQAEFRFCTEDAKSILGDVPLNEPAVALFLREYLTEGIDEVLHTA